MRLLLSCVICFLSSLAFADLKNDFQNLQQRLIKASPANLSANLLGVHEAQCLMQTQNGYESLKALFLIGRFHLSKQGLVVAGVNLLVLPRKFENTNYDTFYFFGQYGAVSAEMLTSNNLWDYVQGFYNGKHNNKNYTAEASTSIQHNSYVSALSYQSQSLRHFLTNTVHMKEDSLGYLFSGIESNFHDGDIPNMQLFFCGNVRKIISHDKIPNQYR